METLGTGRWKPWFSFFCGQQALSITGSPPRLEQAWCQPYNPNVLMHVSCTNNQSQILGLRDDRNEKPNLLAAPQSS